MDTLQVKRKEAPIRRILAKKPYTMHGTEGWLLKLKCHHVVFKAHQNIPIGHERNCYLCLAESEGTWHE